MNRREKEKKEAKRASMRDWAKKPTVSEFESLCVKAPEGFSFAKHEKTGVIKWDFLEYTSGKYNRRTDGPGFTIGELEYERHTIPAGKSVKYVLCRAILGKPCAACDWIKKNGGIADQELVKKMRASTRHLWVISDDPGNPKVKCKIYDTNHFNKKRGFGEQMAAAINTLDEGEEPFALDGGYTAILTVEEDSMQGGQKFKIVTRIDLRKRKYDYPDSFKSLIPCLDDCLVDPGYDEVMRLIDTGGLPTEAESRKPQEPADDDKPTREEEDEDDGEPDGLEKWMKPGAYCTWKGKECKILDVKSSGLVLEDDNEDEHEGIPPARVKKVELADDEDSDDGEEEAQEKKPSRKKRRDPDEEEDDSEDEDSDEDDSDDDEEEEEDVKPADRKRRK